MAKPNTLNALVDLTKTTQTLLAHFQSSLSPSPKISASSSTQTATSKTHNPLEAVKACTTLLKSHTTTLSLLLLTPPLTPSAIITKIGDVSSGALSGLVATVVGTPPSEQQDELGSLMRGELRVQVRRLIGTWGDVLNLVLRFAEHRKSLKGKKDEGPTEAERQEVLAATGVVWEACDALLKLCADGIVGLVVKKAQELRSVLLDAVEELKEWGEDVEDDDEDTADHSDGEGDGFSDEDEIFGAANKLSKGDKELKALLDTSVKKLKMVGVLYQALIKRRLKTFPVAPTVPAPSNETSDDSKQLRPNPMAELEKLMATLRAIPETVDDLASAFYDLEVNEAKETLDKICEDAKSATSLLQQSWAGADDEFTAWSAKWVDAFDTV